jgi:hypothetical protein
MIDAKELDCSALDPIGDDIRCPWNHKFAGARYAPGRPIWGLSGSSCSTDAGNYITKLPKAEHSIPEWQQAMEALMLVAIAAVQRC